MKKLILLTLITSLIFSTIGCEKTAKSPPNIVLIMVDDLNDSPEIFNGHPQTKTPNIKKLASSGVSFLKAYSNNPICGPSRSSLISGVYPHNSSNFWQQSWLQNEVLSNTKTIMEKFKENGYNVIGSGKILHHNKKEIWSEFEYNTDFGPVAYKGQHEKGKKGISHPDVPKPYRTVRKVGCCNMNGGQIDGSFGPLKNVKNLIMDGEQLSWAYGGSRGYKEFKYNSEEDRDLTPDEINAQWAEDRLKKLAKSNDDKPFFLAVGFVRPHTPLIAPKKYFDMYPLEDIQLANILENDKDDTFFHLEDQFETKDRRTRSIESYINLVKSYKDPKEGLKRFTQAYLACVSAVDDNIGQVMNVIDNSKLKDNTIVVLVSDHGWTMGEKDHVYKNSLWEESTRIPMTIRAPGVSKPNSKVEHPVSLIDIYPTLLDLAGLDNKTVKNEKGKPLDGHSLKPFLENPNTEEWNGPKGALSVVYSSDKNKNNTANHHYSLRTKDWRYIIYDSGNEELYNNSSDPKEWNNLLYNKTHPKRSEMVEVLKEITYPMVPNGIKILNKK
ncbi:sulfatase [Flavobacteriaceae bacterium]|nr:sulfatase [Flavobacteriaceae bacterium]